MPIFQNGTEIKQMILPQIGGSGGDEIDKAYMWNGQGWDLVFESFTPYSFYHNFDGLPTGRLITSDYGKWLDSPAPSNDTPVVPYATGGIVRASSTGQDGFFSTWCIHSTPTNSDNFEVSITMDTGANAYSCGVIVGSEVTMKDFAMVQFSSEANAKGIFLFKNASAAASHAYGSETAPAGAVMTLRKTVANDVATYTFLKNGNVVSSYTDTAKVLPASSAGHRYAGMMFTFRRNFFTNYYSAGFTDFRVTDI